MVPARQLQQHFHKKTFSSTCRAHGVRRRPPPEAPGYIDIPQPKQPTRVEIRRPKGFLPIPRDVFKRRRSGSHRFRHKALKGLYSSAPGTLGHYINKTSPAPERTFGGRLISSNLAEVGPKGNVQSVLLRRMKNEGRLRRERTGKTLGRHRHAQKEIAALSDSDQYRLWRERQAESRRRNLRQGIAHMALRRARFRRERITTFKRTTSDRLRRLRAPQRDDERLTAPTVPLVLQPGKRGPLPDPDGPARQARKLSNVATQKARKEEQISSALHTLYMQAQDFIVTDQQLDDAVQEAFEPEGKPRTWSDGPSFWHDETMWPPTIQGMLDQEAGLGRGAPIPPERLEGNSGDDIDAARRRVMKDRLKKIAEELTGGKI
ncbi:MAG: hypothetical protein M1831_002694 [Alyxoria varia]|nr:MAG: hypothetical protein M1831_002694 [Alyxoria varia]